MDSLTKTAMRHILVIEDDADLARMLGTQLEMAGFAVTAVASGAEGLEEAGRGFFGLVILDLGLPDMDGLEVCRQLHARGHQVPMIILSARDSEIDRVVGLELGADDYILKPFSPRELLARIKAVQRRTVSFHRWGGEKTGAILQTGPLTIDLHKRKVLVDRSQTHLTEKEFDLLACLAISPGKVFSRLELLHKIWGYRNECYEHTVTAHVNRLRAKIEANRTDPSLVLTVWGIGYKFREEDGAE